MKEYFDAVREPFGPWALLAPNSTHFVYSPDIMFILVALVQTRDAKLIKFRIGVSIS